MLTVGASVGEALVRAYRDLIPAEARLGEALARRGLRVGAPVAGQWPVLHEHLQLYGRGLSPAGLLVLAGAPDAGSRATGIPFTGPAEARRALGLGAQGPGSSPSGAAFWGAVEAARGGAAEGAALESFFATVHLAHAIPFDAPACPEVLDASGEHLLRLLAALRPQAVAAVGEEALWTLGRALRDEGVRDLAGAGEAAWTRRWSAGTPLRERPWAQASGPRPFRFRLVAAPALDGPLAAQGQATLASVLSLAWT